MGDGVTGQPDYGLVGQAARVDALAAIARLRARLRARLDHREQLILAAMAADPDPYRDGTSDALGKQWVREDVACVLRVPSPTAGAMLHAASALTTRFPATLAAVREGQLSGRYARRLTEATLHLPDRAASKVEERVLPRAPRQTLAQFAASVRRAVLAADPRTAEEQLRDAVAERRVVFTPQDDGTSELWALLPAEQAAALQAKVQQLADSWKNQDERTADQRRADALGSLAHTGPGGKPKTTVNVSVALSTLLAVDEQPGHLAGHGPIPASLARVMAFDPSSTWRRLVTDAHGNLADISSTSYRPPAVTNAGSDQQQRDRKRPTRQDNSSEGRGGGLVHTLEWGHGGRTCPANLMPLCMRHHHLKHDAGWTLKRLPDDTVRWTTPTGHTYDRPPPDSLPIDTTTSAATSKPRKRCKINRVTKIDIVDDEPPPF